MIYRSKLMDRLKIFSRGFLSSFKSIWLCFTVLQFAASFSWHNGSFYDGTPNDHEFWVRANGWFHFNPMKLHPKFQVSPTSFDPISTSCDKMAPSHDKVFSFLKNLKALLLFAYLPINFTIRKACQKKNNKCQKKYEKEKIRKSQKKRPKQGRKAPWF